MAKYTDDDVQKLVETVKQFTATGLLLNYIPNTKQAFEDALKPFEPDPWEEFAEFLSEYFDDACIASIHARSVVNKAVELGLVKRVEDQP